MDYKRHYEQLCKTRQKRTIIQTIYYETHHIIPRCLGGNNDPSNLVKLTPREHYIAHLLLWKSQPRNVRLFWPLQWFFARDGVRIPSRVVQMIKENRQNFVGQKDYLWTKQPEHRLKMSLIGRRTPNRYRRTSEHSTRAKQQMRLAHKNQTHPTCSKEATTGRFPSKKIMVGEVVYASLSEAARAHGISPKSAWNRIKKEEWVDWNYVHEG